MDFFTHQDVARKRTRWLVIYFIAAVLLICIAVYGVVYGAVAIIDGYNGTEDGDPFLASPLQPELLLASVLGAITVIGLGSIYKTSQLAGGGETLAHMLGGQRIQEGTIDPGERQLLNIVEEMAIASGVPVPPVFIMPERGINAFAAGLHPDDAVIGVSSGAIRYLSRDELQGVIAHEYSHILNGDMRLNFRLIGILYGILVIALIGWFVLRSAAFSGGSRRSKNDGGGAALMLAIGVGLLIVGAVGWFFGQLIKAAISRQREFLADASAVQFTRNPDGIAGALKKIGGLSQTSKIETPQAEQASHMFFSNIHGNLMANLFSTHPELAKRISTVDPSWDGRFPKDVKPAKVKPPQQKTQSDRADAGKAAVDAILATPVGGAGAGPMGAIGAMGMPGPAQIILAQAILQELSQPVLDAAAHPFSATALVYAVLLDSDPDERAKQLAAIQADQPEAATEVARIVPQIEPLSSGARLALIEQTFRTLRCLSPHQYEQFRKMVDGLIEMDEKVDLREYTIRLMLVRNLDIHFHKAQRPREAMTSLRPVTEETRFILSVMAYSGTSDPAEAKAAYDEAVRHLDCPQLETDEMFQRSACGKLGTLDAVLGRLVRLTPTLKRMLIESCVICAGHDGKILPREVAIVQATAAALGMPIPHLTIGELEKPQAS